MSKPINLNENNLLSKYVQFDHPGCFAKYQSPSISQIGFSCEMPVKAGTVLFWSDEGNATQLWVQLSIVSDNSSTPDIT